MNDYPYGASYYAKALERIIKIYEQSEGIVDLRMADVARNAIQGIWDDEADQESTRPKTP